MYIHRKIYTITIPEEFQLVKLISKFEIEKKNSIS